MIWYQPWTAFSRRLLAILLALLTCLGVLFIQPQWVAQTIAEQRPPQPEKTEPPAQPATSVLSELTQRRQRLAEADTLYLAGQINAAEKIYREVKPEFPNSKIRSIDRPKPFSEPSQLSPAGGVYWREAQAGLQTNLETRIVIPLKLLVEQQPEFIPGHLQLATALKQYGTPIEALRVLERSVALYPDQADLVRAKVNTLAEQENFIDASIAARQFALLYPQDPAAAEMTRLAKENLDRFQGQIQERLTGNTIASFLTGAATFALTGSILGPLNALQALLFLSQGESGIGSTIAGQARQALDLWENEPANTYVNEIGQKLTRLAGRDDFKYEFNLVRDPDLNAFALPGGKIFLNTGAISKSNSEAELAGLLAHEISHAVLSHGFQMMTQAVLVGNLTQLIPLGGTLGNLILLSYSRDMEQQADLLGTRLLAGAGYAADGLRNLMVTLAKEGRPAPIGWLNSHPLTSDRVVYLEDVINVQGYNRFAFEGIKRHSEIQEQIAKLIQPGDDRRDSTTKQLSGG